MARNTLDRMMNFPARPAFFAGLDFSAGKRFVFGCATSGADMFFSDSVVLLTGDGSVAYGVDGRSTRRSERPPNRSARAQKPAQVPSKEEKASDPDEISLQAASSLLNRTASYLSIRIAVNRGSNLYSGLPHGFEPQFTEKP